MPLFACPKGNVLFIHVPKTGGMSVEYVLSRQVPRALFHTRLSRRKGFNLPCNPQHFHGALLQELIPEDFVFWSFMVVREPIARIKSEYRYRRRNDSSWVASSEDFAKWWSDSLNRYQKNEFLLDNHFRPQVEFVCRNADVYRLEDGMEHIIHDACRNMGLDIDSSQTAPHRNKTEKKQPFVIPATVLEEVKDFYAEDYQRFGYPRGD